MEYGKKLEEKADLFSLPIWSESNILLGMPKLSIIIPTHKRADILSKCLAHIEQQSIAKDVEVIVVSDGHDAQTAQLFEKTWKVPMQFSEIEKSQQGKARNAGVQHATAPLCLFIGDDIFLAPDACEKHLASHAQHPTPHALLGFTTWDPAVGITPVMRWLETSGWQFGYPMIAQYADAQIPHELQHRFTYTSNISLPTEIAKKFPFRTDVSLYGWEDIEWGMRLRDAGIPLFYDANAKAVHHHHITVEQSLKRMEVLGRSVVALKKNVPELDRVPTGWKLIAYKASALLPTMSGKHRKAFVEGMALARADS